MQKASVVIMTATLLLVVEKRSAASEPYYSNAPTVWNQNLLLAAEMTPTVAERVIASKDSARKTVPIVMGSVLMTAFNVMGTGSAVVRIALLAFALGPWRAPAIM
jgi:hypothetical protein